MAKFKESQYFIRKNVTPGSLLPDNLISFAYKSPAGVHDKSPLVIVLEARNDRIFGINLHYDMQEMDELLGNQINAFRKAMEIEWYKKYPKKKQELKKNGQGFDLPLVDKKDWAQLCRRIPRKVMEQFPYSSKDSRALRCYLYPRMTRVSKLVWKT
jgi:hypothetical protein